MIYIYIYISHTHTAYGTPPKVPDVVQDILMTHGLFWQYPQCLPDIGLCKTNS